MSAEIAMHIFKLQKIAPEKETKKSLLTKMQITQAFEIMSTEMIDQWKVKKF